VAFNMDDLIDFDFQTHTIKVLQQSGEYVDGTYVVSANTSQSYEGTVQPLNERERQALDQGGQRVIDARKIYINGYNNIEISPADIVVISDIPNNELVGRFKVFATDIRRARGYCKIMVGAIDE
jgi:hypothetical protein